MIHDQAKSRLARVRIGATAIALAVGCCGCEQAASEYNATVQGTVTIDGELAPRGSVTFHPVKNGPVATGRIHEDGSYSIRTGQGDLRDPDGGKIRSGKYIVTVTVTAASDAKNVVAEGGPPAMGARLTADKYALKDSSDLKFTVEPGPNLFDLKVDGPWANPPATDDGTEGTEVKGEAPDAGSDDAGSDEGEAEQGEVESTVQADGGDAEAGKAAIPSEATDSDQSAAEGQK